MPTVTSYCDTLYSDFLCSSSSHHLTLSLSLSSFLGSPSAFQKSIRSVHRPYSSLPKFFILISTRMGKYVSHLFKQLCLKTCAQKIHAPKT